MDRLLPFNFSVEHNAGKNIGFADYFSKHPTSEAIPISRDDENFVTNLIDSFKFLLKNADIIYSNRKVENNLEQNDVINAKELKQPKQHAFSHSLYTNQLHSLSEISQNSNIVNAYTRKNSNRNTIEHTIIKMFHSPNKKKHVI